LTPAIFALFLFLPSLLNKETNGLNLSTIPSTVLEQTVPGIFAGIILLSIIYTGMMTFQSASQEIKDKMGNYFIIINTNGIDAREDIWLFRFGFDTSIRLDWFSDSIYLMES